MTRSWGRIFSIVLGIWLFFSAFAWEHTQSQFANTWITAQFVVLIGLLSLAFPRARFFNVAVAIWLFFSSFFFPSTGETMWNNCIVAILLLAASLMREAGAHAGPFTRHRRVPV